MSANEATLLIQAVAFHGLTCAYLAAVFLAYAVFAVMFVVGALLILEGCYMWAVAALRRVSSGLRRTPRGLLPKFFRVS
jgi:hypothetical protein